MNNIVIIFHLEKGKLMLFVHTKDYSKVDYLVHQVDFPTNTVEYIYSFIKNDSAVSYYLNSVFGKMHYISRLENGLTKSYINF